MVFARHRAAEECTKYPLFIMTDDAGFGVPSAFGGVIGLDNATIGRILRDHGYATAWFGKDHNTPTYEASQAGPFTQWPTGNEAEN